MYSRGETKWNPKTSSMYPILKFCSCLVYNIWCTVSRLFEEPSMLSSGSSQGHLLESKYFRQFSFSYHSCLCLIHRWRLLFSIKLLWDKMSWIWVGLTLGCLVANNGFKMSFHPKVCGSRGKALLEKAIHSNVSPHLNICIENSQCVCMCFYL